MKENAAGTEVPKKMTGEAPKEATKEIPKEVPKEVPQEIPTVWCDVRKPPFELYGFRDRDRFLRLPEEVMKATSAGVHSTGLMTAGGRVRFSTDSPYVSLRVVYPAIHRMNRMPLSGSSGFDLYSDGEGVPAFRGLFAPQVGDSTGFTAKLALNGGKHLRYFTLNFPLYNSVSSVEIGVEEGSYVGPGKKYRDIPPVVYYGSSITQGADASRPGQSYESVISRRLNTDYVNLGFSGSARGEESIMNYIASLEMSAFVYDYDHNAPTAEHLQNTHKRGFGIVRASHPDLPVIFVSRPGKYFGSCPRRREIIMETYRSALDAGDRRVWFLDGESFYSGPYENECSVDNTHPNDLGFWLMAGKIGAVLSRALDGPNVEN
jgi:hypothetical protein